MIISQSLRDASTVFRKKLVDSACLRAPRVVLGPGPASAFLYASEAQAVAEYGGGLSSWCAGLRGQVPVKCCLGEEIIVVSYTFERNTKNVP